MGPRRIRSRVAQTDPVSLISWHPRTRYGQDRFWIQFRSIFSTARILDRKKSGNKGTLVQLVIARPVWRFGHVVLLSFTTVHIVHDEFLNVDQRQSLHRCAIYREIQTDMFNHRAARREYNCRKLILLLRIKLPGKCVTFAKLRSQVFSVFVSCALAITVNNIPTIFSVHVALSA